MPKPNPPKSPEPKTYAAPDPRDATLAPPAAGEVTEDLRDEGDAIEDPLAEVQTGQDRTRVPEKAHAEFQGPKTLQANRARLRGGPEAGGR